MTLTTPVHHLTQPAVRLEKTGIAAWRVHHRDRGVIGHVSIRSDRTGEVFVARRFHASAAAFHEVGMFSSMDDALDVLFRST